VKFRWKSEEECYVRCKDTLMQHNHELIVKDKYLLQNESVLREINLYMDC